MTVAVIFPGQGSQEVGMLADLRTRFSHIDERLHEASAIVDEDLIHLVADGPASRLNQTEITQPVLLTVSVALFECWTRASCVKVVAAAGHSLGEYSALTAAGVFSFPDAVKLVHERGRLMQAAVPEGSGSMVAVLGLELDDLEEVCNSIAGVVAPANINAPGQVVIAGATESVNAASAKLVDRGAKRIVPLAVSVPSHCELMNSTTEGVSALLESVNLKRPKFPVYHNENAQIANDVDEIRDRLVQQLSSPVQWSATISAMVQAGCEQFVECGPGRVLTGLMRRIDQQAKAISIGSLDAFNVFVGEHE